MTRRTERVSDLLQEELSDILRREVKDPRLSNFVTITEVDVSPDLKFAKVFVSIMGDKEQKKETMAGLTAAAGFLRKLLSERLTLRRVPELSFRPDESIERGTRILELLKDVSPAEEESQAQPPREANE